MKNLKIGFWGFAGILAVLYVISEPLGQMSGGIFILLDRLLYVSSDVSPVTMWCVLGALIGLICGTFVSIRKYNLENRLIIIPVGLLVVVINLILLSS